VRTGERERLSGPRADRPARPKGRHVERKSGDMWSSAAREEDSRRWPHCRPRERQQSARRPLPKVIRMVPACQSMSSRLSRTTRCFRDREIGKASDHRIAAPLRWTGRVERPEKLFQFVPRKCLGQFGLIPARRLRHSVHQIGDVVAEQFAMAEIASNRARHDADRTPAPYSVF
jgi:hypothetical protein